MSTRAGTRMRQTPEQATASARRRIEASIAVDAGGCWEWVGPTDSGGYGKIGIKTDGGRWVTRGAHRVSYELHVGPIPAGLQLDHLCRNRCCVNPDHLEPVTNRENGLRGNSWAGRNARKTHCPRGHVYTPENTRLRSLRFGTVGRECLECARLLRHARRSVTP